VLRSGSAGGLGRRPSRWPLLCGPGSRGARARRPSAAFTGLYPHRPPTTLPGAGRIRPAVEGANPSSAPGRPPRTASRTSASRR